DLKVCYSPISKEYSRKSWTGIGGIVLVAKVEKSENSRKFVRNQLLHREGNVGSARSKLVL
ncbi:hypothetical protein L195_g039934, partial [Trifolium pratense]